MLVPCTDQILSCHQIEHWLPATPMIGALAILLEQGERLFVSLRESTVIANACT
jgi:hypothetical protein